MNALVTGGGGFIGSALCSELVKRGYRVTSLSRGDYPGLRKIGAFIIRGDISDPDLVLKACKGMDIVFHVAAKAGISGDYKDYYKTNVAGTLNIINSCKMNNIKYLIYTSSGSVVFDGKDIEGSDESLPYPSKPVSNYTKTKALAEQLVLHANSPILRTLALRPHIVYGPGDNHLFPKVLLRTGSGRLRRIGNGRNVIDVTYIDNAVAAHINAAEAIINNSEASGRAYFITNGEPVLLWDFLNLMLEFSGHQPVKKSIPYLPALIFSILSELVHKIFFRSGEPFLTRFLVSELSRSHWFNISHARRMLNYNPQISNIEGLKKMNTIQ